MVFERIYRVFPDWDVSVRGDRHDPILSRFDLYYVVWQWLTSAVIHRQE